jgi:hypothetical protein
LPSLRDSYNGAVITGPEKTGPLMSAHDCLEFVCLDVRVSRPGLSVHKPAAGVRDSDSDTSWVDFFRRDVPAEGPGTERLHLASSVVD